MIDIHCHYLPGLDDGPETMEQALAVAKLAVADGITHAIVTPHIHPGRWDNTRDSIAMAAEQFSTALADAGIPLNIGMAAEVRLDAAIIPLIQQYRIPFLGRWQNQKVLLLELPHGGIPPGTEKLVEWLLKQNILPMIAHPERNKAIMRNPERLQPLLALGCLVQMTAGALCGQFGERVQEVARALLQQGIPTVLASDAHNVVNRRPNLSEGHAQAAALMGADCADALVYRNPMALFESNAMV